MDFRNPCVDTSSDLVADQERCGARDHIRESREECFLADGSVWGDPKQSTQCGTFRSRPARTSLIFPQPPPRKLELQRSRPEDGCERLREYFRATVT